MRERRIDRTREREGERKREREREREREIRGLEITPKSYCDS